jgi:Gpi18-like mannosyltransferase
VIGGLVSISGFFDQDFILWKFKIPKRILVPIIILIAAKIAGSLFIYYSMNIQSLGTFWSDPSRVFNWPQNNVLLKYARTAGNIPYIFVGWDSAWYLSIITHGYTFSPQAYTFMPGLPIFGYLFSLILQNPTTAIAACGLIFGVVWLPFYQLLAEVCIDKQAALASGLLIAFSPYLFVFTTVAYGEGLFLFFTLSTLYLFKKRKTAASSLLAGLAILTSVMGMALVPPMLYSSVRQKDKHRIRNIVLSVLPLAAIPLWLGYCLTSSKDLLASIHTTEWGGLYTVPSFLLQDLPQMGLKAFSQIPLQNWPAQLFWLSPVAIFLALAVSPFIIYKLIKINGALALYSLAGYLGFVVFGAIVSAPRFASVLFPLWLPVTAKLTLKSRKQVVFIAAILTVSFVISLDMWMSFLNGQFVA